MRSISGADILASLLDPDEADADLDAALAADEAEPPDWATLLPPPPPPRPEPATPRRALSPELRHRHRLARLRRALVAPCYGDSERVRLTPTDLEAARGLSVWLLSGAPSGELPEGQRVIWARTVRRLLRSWAQRRTRARK